MDQVTCYAAYSVERGQAKAAKKQSLQLVVTDDDYRSLGLDSLLVDLAKVTAEAEKKLEDRLSTIEAEIRKLHDEEDKDTN